MTWQQSLAQKISEKAEEILHGPIPWKTNMATSDLCKQAVLDVLNSLKLPGRPNNLCALHAKNNPNCLNCNFMEGKRMGYDSFIKALGEQEKVEEKDGLDELWEKHDKRYASANEWRVAMKQAIREWAKTPRPSFQEDECLNCKLWYLHQKCEVKIYSNKSECLKCGKQLFRTPKPEQKEEKEFSQCLHCKGNILERNPSGFCDHLYYPEYCDVCNEKSVKESKDERIRELANQLARWKLHDLPAF